MPNREIDFRYQVGTTDELERFQSRIRSLIGNYRLETDAQVLVYLHQSVQNTLVLTPKWGSIESVNLKPNATPGFLHAASPYDVTFLISDNESTFGFLIEYSPSGIDRETGAFRGNIAGNLNGDNSTFRGNVESSLVRLVTACPEGVVLDVSSGFRYTMRFAEKK